METPEIQSRQVGVDDAGVSGASVSKTVPAGRSNLT